jgi:RNA polymerase sigma-70 factor (ECF subfamily)
MDGTDDEQLVARCLGGDVEAFAPLVERYQKVLFNVAYRVLGNREDARDATQTAFVKAYTKLATYDSAHRFFSWIYRIVVNESLNVRTRRPPHLGLDETLVSSASPHAEAEARETSARIQAGLQKLTPEHREVVVLRHFAELSYSDIGAALGLPEKTVKSRLYTARQRLGQILLDGEARP